MKIGEEVYIHGYIDEIRKDTVIIRNEGGYFGTAPSEIKVLEQNNEEIYKAGYEDGVHDGYYSSSIKDGTEEKYFGKSYQKRGNSDDSN